MIEGDVSGVLFTVNPTNQNRKEMMINASYGLGEAVVSGIVTPDTVIWDCEANQIKNEILGSKEISIIYGQSTGTIQIDNGEEKKNSFSISDEQIEYLVKLGGKIEKHYGYPQDIEWAIKNNKIYILQARGITTLKNTYKVSEHIKNNRNTRKESHIRNKIINNLIEHCPTPLYPLEFETFKNVMDGKSKVFSEFGIFMKDQLEIMDDGRLEINISSTHISPGILKIPFKIKYLIDYPNNMKHTKDNFTNINNKLKNIENNLNSHKYNHSVNVNTKKLLNLLEKIMNIAKKIIYIRFRYNVFPSVIVGKLIHSKLQKIEKGMTEYDLLRNLEYKTWNMNKSIENLADIVNNNVKIKNEILDLKGKNKDELNSSLEYISASYKDFENCYKHILNEFGWKSANSYQAFSAVSWNEDKSNFIALLQAAIKGKFEREDKNKYEHICDKANSRFSRRTYQKLIEKFKQIRKYHVNREESLYMLEACYGLSRKIIRMIAYKYPEIFEDDRDILYLTLNEVYKLDEEPNISFFKKTNWY
jgi:Phosphoenolpyruvate synthase/pyruvate phosphate dikinase